MKVYIDREWEEYSMLTIREADEGELYIDISESLYKEFKNIMRLDNEMQERLEPLRFKMDTQLEDIRKSEKIKKLKKELQKLES